MSRVLIIARDMVGDLVNTTGAVHALLEAYPDSEVDLECGRAGAVLFAHISPRLRVIPRDRHGGLTGRLRRVHAYRRGHYDLALMLDPSRTRTKLCVWAGIPRVVAPVRKPGAIGHAELLPVPVGGHDLFPSLELILRHLGIKSLVAPRIVLRDEDERWAAELPLPNEVGEGVGGRGPVALFVGASDLPKRWPRWHELAPEGNWFAMCGPGEEFLLEGLPLPHVPPAPNLLAFAALLKRCRVLITADTGPAHLAAAVGTPCVVLYGPTSPERYYPWPGSPPHEFLHHPSPCDHYGSGCAFKEAGVCNQRCMSQITPGEVHAAIERVLSRQT